MSFFKKRLKLGLREEIILSITLLMIAAILLVSHSVLAIVERDIRRNKMRTLRLIAAAMETSLDQTIVDGGLRSSESIYRATMALTRRFAREGYISKVVMVNSDYKVTASDYDNLIGQTLQDHYLVEAMEKNKTVVSPGKSNDLGTTTGAKGPVEITIPVGRSGAAPKFAVRLTMPVSNGNASIARSRKLILFYLMPLYSLIFIVFGSYILTRRIVNPIRMLADSTKRLARGDLDERVQILEDNEIGRLASAFNEMAAVLAGNKVSLEQHVSSLKSMNQELNKTQEEVIKSEKLATVGKFASGVAHELGNPLGAILGYTEILKSSPELKSVEDAQDYLDRIEREIKRVNKIIRELLDFSRPKAIEIIPIDVNSVIEDSVRLLEDQKLLLNIEMALDLDPQISHANADEHQFQQVMINMILNAVDSMKHEGKVSITTTAITGEEADAEMVMSRRRSEDPPGQDFSYLRKPEHVIANIPRFEPGKGLVKIAIADTGTGIRSSNLSKIFDPFFTTKDPGEGTGLGLTVCLRIIESFGGRIKVESDFGKGSTFEILLPM